MSEQEGAFAQQLKRNNAKIREDRAESITEDAQMLFKRTIEDIELRIKKLKREQDNQLDLSPNDANSLRLASDFNADEFVNTDINLGISIRTEEIRLEVARARYEYLFGQGN